MSVLGKITGSALANGSVTSYYSFWIDWKRNSYSIEKNTSNITVELKVQCTANADSAWNLSQYPSVSLNINGAAKTPTLDYIDTRNNVVCLFAKWSGDINHADDGSLNCPITATFTHYGSSTLSGGTLSGTATLDTIPRASAVSSAADVTLGNKCSVKWVPFSKSFRYKLKFVLKDWEYITNAIHPDTTSLYSYTEYTIPLDVARQITNTRTDTMTVYLYTYSDTKATTQVGSTYAKTFKVTVPDNSSTQPTVSMTLAPVGSLGSAFEGLYVQGKTKVKAILFASGKYDATIVSKVMSVGGIEYDFSQNYTSDYLNNPGSFTVHGYGKDSRGITGSASQEITVIGYAKPKILNTEVSRCDAKGNVASDGTYLKIKAKRSYSPVNSGGSQKNFCQIRYRYKVASASAWSAWIIILDKNSTASDTVETGALLNGALAVDTTYQVQVQAIDDIGDHSETTIDVPTDKVHTHRARNSIGFGKYSEKDNCLDMGWDIELNDKELLRNGVPAFARSGHGLGNESPTIITDFDAAIFSGWYRYNASTANSPFPQTDGLLRVDSYGNNSTKCVEQTVWSYNFTTLGIAIIRRVCKNDVWDEWEWVKPLLAAGQEYRTTERFAGNAIYKQLLTIGGVSAGGTVNIEHGIVGISYPIKCQVFSSRDSISDAVTELKFDRTNVRFTLPSDIGGYSMYAILSYCVEQ